MRELRGKVTEIFNQQFLIIHWICSVQAKHFLKLLSRL